MNLTLKEIRQIAQAQYSYYMYDYNNFPSFEIIHDYKYINSILKNVQKCMNKYNIEYSLKTDVSGHVVYYIKKADVYIITFDNYYLVVCNDVTNCLTPVCKHKDLFVTNSFYDGNLAIPQISLEIKKNSGIITTRYFLHGKMHNQSTTAINEYCFQTNKNKIVKQRYYLNGRQYSKLEWLKEVNAPREQIIEHLKTTSLMLEFPRVKVKLVKEIEETNEMIVNIDEDKTLQIYYNEQYYRVDSMSNCGKFLKITPVQKEDVNEDE